MMCFMMRVAQETVNTREHNDVVRLGDSQRPCLWNSVLKLLEITCTTAATRTKCGNSHCTSQCRNYLLQFYSHCPFHDASRHLSGQVLSSGHVAWPRSARKDAQDVWQCGLYRSYRAHDSARLCQSRLVERCRRSLHHCMLFGPLDLRTRLHTETKTN